MITNKTFEEKVVDAFNAYAKDEPDMVLKEDTNSNLLLLAEEFHKELLCYDEYEEWLERYGVEFSPETVGQDLYSKVIDIFEPKEE